MNKLWHFDDYVNHLTHKNGIVRRWAFNALENRFPNKYVDQVSYLLNDEDEHMVCSALRYLSTHKAIDYAPAILEIFKSSQGIIASNSAAALAGMQYEPAMDTILEKSLYPDSGETFLGILQYLGEVRSDQSREAMLSAANQVDDSFLRDSVISSLLYHYNSEDVKLVMDIYFDSDNRYDVLLKNILYPAGGDSYFTDLTEYGENLILSEPVKTFKNLLLRNSQIQIDQSLLDRLIQSIENKQYEDFITILMFEARSIISSRYSDNNNIDKLKKLFEQDTLCIGILEDLSKRSAAIKEIMELSSEGPDLIAFIISFYLGLLERGAYVNAFLPGCSNEDLIYALENAGSSLPEIIQEKIKEQSPVPKIKKVLKKDISSWGGIWAVRMMGEIGDKSFVPDLINVLSDSDSLDYIYSDALRAINALDESAHEMILAAIKDNGLSDWESFPVLEHLPYSEAYDLAVKRWDSESDDEEKMDSYEMFATCLKGIGDKRGIEKLQQIYAYEDDSAAIGNALECLSELHQVDIPEIHDIRKSRKKRDQRLKKRRGWLDELANNYEMSDEEEEIFKKPATVVPFKRESPKIGRNDPCPCGSGKKYKKCCLNKDNS